MVVLTRVGSARDQRGHETGEGDAAMKRFLMVICLAVAGTGGAGLGLSSSAHIALGKGTGTILGLSYSDPTGDSRGPIDVTGTTISWDSQGNYTIGLTAGSQHPFTGQFRVIVNLYDASAPKTYSKGAKSYQDFFSFACKNCSVFSPKMNAGDFNLGATTQTSLTITGKNSVLPVWSAGDQVGISSFTSLGNPPDNSVFRSNVSGLPTSYLTNEDMIGVDDTACSPSQPIQTACPIPQSDSTATITTM
jgi:hypothetical protein